MTSKTLGKALVLALAFVSASSQAFVAHLTLTGTPGDFISGGHSVDNIYSSTTPGIYIYPSRPNGVMPIQNIGTPSAPQANWLEFLYFLTGVPDDELTMLTFAAPQVGEPLAAGVTYTGAQRAYFQQPGTPGLSVDYGHRGCNQLSGNFTVNQLRFSGSDLAEFGVSFDQSCDGGALMHGTFYYNASLNALPTNDVPEPGTCALLGLGAAGLAALRRRKQVRG